MAAGRLAHRFAKPLAAPKSAAVALASQAARVAALLPPHRAGVRGGDPGIARLNRSHSLLALFTLRCRLARRLRSAMRQAACRPRCLANPVRRPYRTRPASVRSTPHPRSGKRVKRFPAASSFRAIGGFQISNGDACRDGRRPNRVLLAAATAGSERHELSRRAEPDPAWPARPTHNARLNTVR
jgi:hypothetical protein